MLALAGGKISGLTDKCELVQLASWAVRLDGVAEAVFLDHFLGANQKLL